MRKYKKYGSKFILIEKIAGERCEVFGFYILLFSIVGIYIMASGKNMYAYSKPAISSLYTNGKVLYATSLIKEHLELEHDNITTETPFEVKYAVQNETLEAAKNENIPSGLPVDGIISSAFGAREDPLEGTEKAHKGIDIAIDINTEVSATASGVVSSARYSDSYGYIVEIDHGNGYLTKYAHNNSLSVKTGDFVAKGQTVALSGNTGYSTGPHLHYEVVCNGTPINPLEPVSKQK